MINRRNFVKKKKKAEDITNTMITNILEIFRKSTILDKQNQIKVQPS